MRKNTPEPWRVIGGRNVATQDDLIIAIPTGDTIEETRALSELVAATPVTVYERDRLKAINAELLKVMAQACKDLSAIVWTDDALAVRYRLQAAITATAWKP